MVTATFTKVKFIAHVKAKEVTHDSEIIILQALNVPEENWNAILHASWREIVKNFNVKQNNNVKAVKGYVMSK